MSDLAVASRDTDVGVPWRRWAVVLALPATVLGVLLYPAPNLSPMPLAPALALLGTAGLLIALTGRLRLMILLPVVAAYIPSLQIGFAAILLTLALFVAAYGGQRLVRPLDHVDRLLLAVLVWAAGAWVVNLGIETDLWSLPMLLITFFAPWLLLFVARAVPWTGRDLQVILGAWLALALAQLGPALLKPVALGVPEAFGNPLILLQIGRLPLLRVLVGEFSADMITGTTFSAHHLGVLLLLAFTLLLTLALAAGRRLASLLLVVTLFAFLMTDSKHVVLASVIPGAVLARMVIWPALAGRTRALLRIGALGLLLIVGLPILMRALDPAARSEWRSYVALSAINPKTQLILRTGRVLAENDLQTWLGHGPGAYATRAATIRATDVLFKEADRLPGFIPPHTGRTYRSVAFDLYTFAIADQVRYRSGALTNPFSSLVGIIGEFGLAGSVLVFALVLAVAREGYRLWRTREAGAGLRAAGATLGFAMPLFVVLGIFDSYFEQPDLTGALAVLAIVGLAGRDATRAPA